MAHTHILKSISRAFHLRNDDIVNEPLPERWVDLIKYLNEKDRAARRSEEPKTKPPH